MYMPLYVGHDARRQAEGLRQRAEEWREHHYVPSVPGRCSVEVVRPQLLGPRLFSSAAFALVFDVSLEPIKPQRDKQHEPQGVPNPVEPEAKSHWKHFPRPSQPLSRRLGIWVSQFLCIARSQAKKTL